MNIRFFLDEDVHAELGHALRSRGFDDLLQLVGVQFRFAALVFLNLLKRYADHFRELFLS